MSFLLFLRGLVGVLLVFALTSYFLTQSLWTTFIQTVICAILIQLGYFAAVLFMVWRGDGRSSQGSSEAGETPSDKAAGTEGTAPAKTGRLPGVPRSRIP
jgi:exopolysaccharide production repressor protein